MPSKISSTGILTPLKNGKVKVVASSIDGSFVNGSGSKLTIGFIGSEIDVFYTSKNDAGSFEAFLNGESQGIINQAIARTQKFYVATYKATNLVKEVSKVQKYVANKDSFFAEKYKVFENVS